MNTILKKNWLTSLRLWVLGLPKIEANINVMYAFTIGTTDFFTFDNFNEIPTERAYAIAAFYERFRMRLTRDDLEFELGRLREAIDAESFKKSRVLDIVKSIEDRLNYTFEIETAYDLASAVFFKRGDNPLRFDPVTAAKNKQIFMKADLPDFFLSLPLQELQPYLKMPHAHFQDLLQETLKKMEKYYTNLQADYFTDDSKNYNSGYIGNKLKRIQELISML